MGRDLHLPDERYLAALRRQRARIHSGLELELDDSNATGAKHTHASWGMCSEDKEAWPDAQDHLWPEQFEQGRVAPLYPTASQWCPFDAGQKLEGREARVFGDQSLSIRLLGASGGCFYRCRLFQARKLGGRPDRKRALELYDERIASAASDGSGDGCVVKPDAAEAREAEPGQ